LLYSRNQKGLFLVIGLTVSEKIRGPDSWFLLDILKKARLNDPTRPTKPVPKASMVGWFKDYE